MKKVKNLNNVLKKRVRPALLAVILLFIMGFGGYNAKADTEDPNKKIDEESNDKSVNINTPSGRGITLNKTAEPLGNDLYNIKFNIQGDVPQKEIVKADIIMVVDESSSMEDKIDEVKAAAQEFINTITDKTNPIKSDVRIAISTFGKYAYNEDGMNFSRKKVDLINAVKSLKARQNEGTNTEAGMQEVKKLLELSKKENSDAKRYVLFFTDGLPTYYYNGSNVAGVGYASYDRYFKEAQKEYNKIKGSIDTIGGIGYYIGATDYYGQFKYYDDYVDDGWNNYVLYNDKYTYAKEQGKLTGQKGNDNYPEAKMYSVGLFTDDTDEKMAKQFLSTIQNVASTQSEWADKYYTNDKDKIVSIFMSIADKVVAHINETIIEEGKITDVLPSTFTLPENLKDKEIKVKVNGTEVEPSDGFFNVDTELVEIDGKTKNIEVIRFDLSKITQSPNDDNKVHIEISYNVTASDPYFSGENLQTNEWAKLTGKDPLKPNENIEGTFPVPHVTIAPKVGSITIQKVVNEGTDKSKSDKFPIYITRKNTDTGGINDKVERYVMELVGNETKTMNFYLRGNTTDVSKITNATDMTKNYVTAGTFTANEIVPMDYQNQSMKYSYDNKTWNELNPETEFNIDKDHPNVYINVTNKLVNDKYWRDSADVSNTFIYTGDSE